MNQVQQFLSISMSPNIVTIMSYTGSPFNFKGPVDMGQDMRPIKLSDRIMVGRYLCVDNEDKYWFLLSVPEWTRIKSPNYSS